MIVITEYTLGKVFRQEIFRIPLIYSRYSSSGSNIPSSVIILVMSEAGVTSNAGFITGKS